jgi:DeoR family fructose operon transcriptional repressor
MRILDLLETQRALKVSSLSSMLGASEASIRRDLERLESAGLLRRIHGGAVSNETAAFEPSLAEKQDQHRETKRAIASAAAELIRETETIFLDAGSTTLEIARKLKHRRNLRVVTNGLNLAAELAGSRVEVIVIGGTLRPETLALVGPIAGGTLSDLHLDKLFLGTNGIDLERGVTTPNLAEAESKRAMLRSAREAVLVADSSKFGRAAFARICGLERLHTLITDDGAPQATLDAIAKLGVRVVVVPARAASPGAPPPGRR